MQFSKTSWYLSWEPTDSTANIASDIILRSKAGDARTGQRINNSALTVIKDKVLSQCNCKTIRSIAVKILDVSPRTLLTSQQDSAPKARQVCDTVISKFGIICNETFGVMLRASQKLEWKSQ